MAAVYGNTKHSPAGIRIGNEKHMLTYIDKENKVIQLVKKDGGACIGKSASYLVVGVWNKNEKTSL